MWSNGFVQLRGWGKGPVRSGQQLTTRIVRGLSLEPGFTPKASNDVGGSVVVPNKSDLPASTRPVTHAWCFSDRVVRS